MTTIWRTCDGFSRPLFTVGLDQLVPILVWLIGRRDGCTYSFSE